MRHIKFTEIFSLKTRDFLKSMIMFVGVPVLYYLQEVIPGYDLHPMLKIAISAAITYLLKNFFTPLPTSIEINPAKTAIVDENTKEVMIVKPSNVRDDTLAERNKKMNR